MIVVGTDGSTGARTALRWALDDAARLGCPVVAVRVWPGVSSLVRQTTEARAREERERTALEREVDDALRGLPHAPPVLKELAEGDPATELLGFAADTAATTLVLGRRGLGAVAGTLLGSVTARCLAHAATTVVVVPPVVRTRRGRVVAGVSDSAESVEALRWAAAEASLRGATLQAVHAYDGIAFGDDRAVARMAAGVLDAAIDKAGVHDAERLVEEDDAVPALVRAADRADLLVLGARSRHLASAIAATSLRCAESAAVPTAVVRARPRP